MFSFRRQEAMDPQEPASAIPDHVIERPRRGSVMSLSQTLYSLDSSPPPPADLEQIHASSSQAPGLTTFSLASPPGGSTEQLSLNRLYSRVKRVAAAVRDVVGVPGGESGNRSRISIGSIGSDRYRGHADSRDSFVSSATVDSEDLGMPTSPLSPIKSHFSRHSIIASTSSLTPVSRVSSNNSMTSTTMGGDYAPPTALRKVNLRAAAGGAPVPSLAPVTAFRDGDGSGFISLASPGLGVARMSDVSRNNSEANLQNTAKEVARPPKYTVNALLGTTGMVVAGTVGYPPVPMSKGDQDDENVRQDEDDERSNCSMSEDAISESSDDDVVLLNSRLPGGHDSDKPGARGNKSSIKVAGPSPDNQTFQKSTNKDNGSSTPAPLNISNSNHLPPSATGSDGSSSDSNGGASFGNSPLVSPSTSPAAAAKSIMSLPPQGDKLSPSYVHQQMQQTNTSGQLPLPLPKAPITEPARKKRPPMVPRITTDQGNLLPGFSIAREESSESGSSHGATSTADIGKRSGGSSVYQDRDYQDHREFQNDGMTNGGNTGPNGGAGTGNSEAVSQALRQLRMGNLTNDFWMKDEVCKECFLCANTFSVFRRKHHCRKLQPRYTFLLLSTFVCRLTAYRPKFCRSQ